jgi:hypothetical protein
MRRVTQFIPSSLETCAPHWRACTFAPSPTTWLVAVCTPYVPPMVGVHVRAPQPCAPHCRARPVVMLAPTNARAPPPCAPSAVDAPAAVRAPTAVCAPLPFVPHEVFVPLVCAPRDVCALRWRPTRRACPPFTPHETYVPSVRAHRSRSRPTPCTPLRYNFIKIVVHSTT